MEAHEDLLKWARSKGVELNGVLPRRIPGRGVGMETTRRVKPDEVLLSVPTRALRTLDTVPKTVSRKLPRDMSIHGLLAADLALDQTDKYAEWNAVIPATEDLEAMPLAWDRQLQEHLPCRAKELLRKQQVKFNRDWDIVSKAFPSLSQPQYMYAWLLVNTRTFYYVSPRTEKLHRDDRMVLQPVADLFNHADQGCKVSFDTDYFTIISNRVYKAGEEVHICYGKHSNDFLLLEYGFVLGENRWDEVCLDGAILPLLSSRQKQQLDDCGFLGNYMLDAETVCYRTQVAIRILCIPLREWRRFVNGADDGSGSQEKVDEMLTSLLETYKDSIEETALKLDSCQLGEDSQRRLLMTRWTQISALVESTIQRLRA